MNPKDSQTEWLTRVLRLIKSYQRVKIGDGPGRMTAKRMIADIRSGGCHIVGSLIEKGLIPAGICDANDVKVTTNGNRVRIHPPPKLSEWWDKKLLS